MNGKLALSFAVAALIVAVGGLFAVYRRLGDSDTPKESGSRGRPPVTAPAPGADRPGLPAAADEGDPLTSKDPLVKLDWLVKAASENEDNAYDYYTDLARDLHELKREVAQIEATLRQVIQGIARPGSGGLPGIGWALAPRETPLDEATKKAYREAAEAAGVTVEDGRVTVRGFLNMSPNKAMPIEYFMTRYPEAGHETLVHLLGKKSLEEMRESPYGALKGLATALYKGLVAAGFREGMGSHVDPASDPKQPRWILATGDVVYVACRYERGGATHVARATDWVVEDPETGRALPPDCFRFTGSARGEDPETGDQILGAEMAGLLVSVWPNAQALVEVALESARENDYTYNFQRIPRPEGQGPLYLDVIFSKTPIAPEGEGALERLADAGKPEPQQPEAPEDGVPR